MTSRTIWPWWVRASHWLVAAGVTGLWILSHVYYETDALHRWIGYAICMLIALRVIAGCFTKWPSAKLTLPSKLEIIGHLKELTALKLPLIERHNPLGQLAVYLIWTIISLLAYTGWLSRTDMFWGEDWPVDMHAWLSCLLMGVVAVHVFAVLVIGRISRQHLILQMLHGKLHLDATRINDRN